MGGCLTLLLLNDIVSLQYIIVGPPIPRTSLLACVWHHFFSFLSVSLSKRHDFPRCFFCCWHFFLLSGDSFLLAGCVLRAWCLRHSQSVCLLLKFTLVKINVFFSLCSLSLFSLFSLSLACAFGRLSGVLWRSLGFSGYLWGSLGLSGGQILGF